ncbi:unnamed protein product [Pleuronectes platessa]|uniref:Uncharacterized protein n=1 Tax=Pleuronectes platessa TaxID=8262 RepID=A0A9N7ULR0_PLEPL|nr:unnamed protein product [Pleuronectes platessa]
MPAGVQVLGLTPATSGSRRGRAGSPGSRSRPVKRVGLQGDRECQGRASSSSSSSSSSFIIPPLRAIDNQLQPGERPFDYTGLAFMIHATEVERDGDRGGEHLETAEEQFHSQTSFSLDRNLSLHEGNVFMALPTQVSLSGRASRVESERERERERGGLNGVMQMSAALIIPMAQYSTRDVDRTAACGAAASSLVHVKLHDTTMSSVSIHISERKAPPPHPHLKERDGEGGRENLLILPLPSPPTVTYTPSVSAGLYPQPPAACLEQQQRETVGSQRSWQGRETVGERKEEGREEVGRRGDSGYGLYVFN